MKLIFLVLSWVCLVLGGLCLVCFVLSHFTNRVTLENIMNGTAISDSQRAVFIRGAILWFVLAALFGLAGGAL